MDLLCQSVKWWWELHHWGTLWRCHCLISPPAPSLSGSFCSACFSPSLSLSLFVQFWYADRLTLKRGSHGDKKGPLTSPGTRQTPIQRLHAILKSQSGINRQSTFTCDLFFAYMRIQSKLFPCLHISSKFLPTKLSFWRGKGNLTSPCEEPSPSHLLNL